MIWVYFSYPYTDAPIGRTAQIKEIVCLIIEERKEKFGENDIIPFIPHLAFDALYGFPHGYSHEEMGRWEIEMIRRCDVFAFDPKHMSAGVRWEKSIAQTFKKPIVTFKQLRDGWRRI